MIRLHLTRSNRCSQPISSSRQVPVLQTKPVSLAKSSSILARVFQRLASASVINPSDRFTEAVLFVHLNQCMVKHLSCTTRDRAFSATCLDPLKPFVITA